MANCRFSDVEGESLRRLPPIRGFEKEKLVSIQEAIKPLEKIVPDIKHMLHIVEDEINLKYGLTVDEYLAIRLYSLEWITQDESLYMILNETLRNPKRELSLPPWFKFLGLILTALSKLPTSDTRTVYRGVKLNLRDKYNPGRRIVWWGFSSCTTTIAALEDKFLGKTGPRTLFAVESNKGKEISSLSFYPDEKEILFAPGREFEIIGSLDMGNDLCMVQLKEVNPKFPNIVDFPISNPATAIVDSPLPHPPVTVVDLPPSNPTATVADSPLSNQTATFVESQLPPVIAVDPPLSNPTTTVVDSPLSNQTATVVYSPPSNPTATVVYSPLSNPPVTVVDSPLSNQTATVADSPLSNPTATVVDSPLSNPPVTVVDSAPSNPTATVVDSPLSNQTATVVKSPLPHPPSNVVKVSYKRKGIYDDKVANILEDALEKQKCTHLDLSENHITARGADIIATALKNNKYQE